MKTFATAFLMLLLGMGMKAQCPQGNVILITQSLVDAFGEDWPECRTISGNVILGFEHSAATVTDLSPLANVERIEGSLYIRQQDFLTSLHGLGNLKYIGEDFELIENTLLSDLHGLDQLDTIGGEFIIMFNSELTTLKGLESLQHAKGFWAGDNDKLLNLDGLDQLLPDSRIVLLYNIALSDISGFKRLPEFGGFLSIGGSEALREIQILEGIDSLELLGLGSLPMLESLAGLETLIHTDDLYIGLDAITDLSGLSGLKSVENTFYINYNDALVSLHGLENLQSIGSSVNIIDNKALTDLDALNHPISFGASELVIEENSALSDCAVQAVCNWLAGPEIENVRIENNFGGCQSEAEVEAACLEEGLFGIAVKLSPNPARNLLDIATNLSEKEVSILIYNAAGQLLREERFMAQHQLDISKLSPGVYFLQIRAEEYFLLEKLVKM